ncbi:MAG: WW domain-containing protein [Terracidiphilus sp.]|nr:WW domain-containing protein [Terracidiphilus sp.]
MCVFPFSSPSGSAADWATATAPDGRPYYYNSVTMETTYDMPAVLKAAEKAVEPVKAVPTPAPAPAPAPKPAQGVCVCVCVCVSVLLHAARTVRCVLCVVCFVQRLLPSVCCVFCAASPSKCVCVCCL